MVKTLRALAKTSQQIYHLEPEYRLGSAKMRHISALILGVLTIGFTCLGVNLATPYSLKYFFYETCMYKMRLTQFYVFTEMIQNRLRFIFKKIDLEMRQKKTKKTVLLDLIQIYEDLLDVTDMINSCFGFTWLVIVFLLQLTATETIYILYKYVLFSGTVEMLAVFCAISEICMIALWLTMTTASCQGCATMVSAKFCY